MFDFESGYQDVVVHILDEKGQFDFVFVREKYSDSLMKLLSLVSTPYNTVIDNSIGIINTNKIRQYNVIL